MGAGLSGPDGAPGDGPVGVTDHAVLRYLERVLGLDVEAVRAEIAAVLGHASDHLVLRRMERVDEVPVAALRAEIAQVVAAALGCGPGRETARVRVGTVTFQLRTLEVVTLWTDATRSREPFRRRREPDPDTADLEERWRVAMVVDPDENVCRRRPGGPRR